MDILTRLIKVFKAIFDGSADLDSITVTSSLREDIGINSIGLLYMAMAVEEEFGIKFNNEDFTEICTVGDVIACIERKC